MKKEHEKKKKDTPVERGEENPPSDTETPKEKCEREHAGQAGYCDNDGNFHEKV